MQPGDRRADGRGVQHRVRVVDVRPRLQAHGLSVHVGDVAAVAVGQRTRTGHAGVVAAGLERRRQLRLVDVELAERLLEREHPAGGDETAYLTLLTPRRFDLQPGVGAEVEAVCHLGGHLTVHGPMVTVVPRARRVGGYLAGDRGRGNAQRGSLRYAS